ncbi:TVP38/TMEM64 family protein [Ferruginivarius sediminum]|nr:TVP38/TMEM64 family protein [Ferruginivarius sediminum]
MKSEVEPVQRRGEDASMREVNGNGDTKQPVLRRLLPVLILALGFAAFFLLDLDRYLSFEALAEHRDWLTGQVEENAFLASAGYILAYALVAALSIPGGAILTILGGFLFGTWLGAAYAVIGATLGSVAVFLAARTALHDILLEKAGSAVKRMRAGFQENALSYLLVLRLIPVCPFWLVNLVPAFLGVPLGTYTLGTLVGIVPGSLVYASLGNGLGAVFAAGQTPDIGIIFDPVILGPILGLAVLAMLPVAYKKYRGRRTSPR